MIRVELELEMNNILSISLIRTHKPTTKIKGSKSVKEILQVRVQAECAADNIHIHK